MGADKVGEASIPLLPHIIILIFVPPTTKDRVRTRVTKTKALAKTGRFFPGLAGLLAAKSG